MFEILSPFFHHHQKKAPINFALAKPNIKQEFQLTNDLNDHIVSSLYILQPSSWTPRFDGMMMKIHSIEVGGNKIPASKWPGRVCCVYNLSFYNSMNLIFLFLSSAIKMDKIVM